MTLLRLTVLRLNRRIGCVFLVDNQWWGEAADLSKHIEFTVSEFTVCNTVMFTQYNLTSLLVVYNQVDF